MPPGGLYFAGGTAHSRPASQMLRSVMNKADRDAWLGVAASITVGAIVALAGSQGSVLWHGAP